MCRKNVPGNIVHTKVTKVAFEFLKARISSTLVWLIPKSNHDQNFLLQLMQTRLVLFGYFRQDDASISLRSCIYWAKILNDCEARYNSYGCEALAVRSC